MINKAEICHAKDKACITMVNIVNMTAWKNLTSDVCIYLHILSVNKSPLVIVLFGSSLCFSDWKYNNILGLERVLKLLMVIFLMENDKKWSFFLNVM